jgi:hypothetical protein
MRERARPASVVDKAGVRYAFSLYATKGVAVLNSHRKDGEMTEGLVSRTVETPEGTFTVYMGSAADNPSTHKPLRWYYVRAGGKTEKPSSPDYYSAQAAQEALWEQFRREGEM